jgi:hypothetical protein
VGIRNGVPTRFTPKGLCDAFDATDAFQGACALLTNLIFDQANPEIIVSRPGVGAPLTSFAGFTTPTFVSVQIVIGTMVYGMVSTARTPGFDEPFAYNILTNSFVTITGVTSANVPASPATSGAWTPPTMAVVSTYILVTHPGFSGAGANIFGAINIAVPTVPVWSAQDLATNPMGKVPTSVANFNNRAYFAYNSNHLALSDVLVPLTRTNASQDLTIGDVTPITAQSGLPVQTTSSGVVGALIVFKGSSIWQITGDPVNLNQGENFISLNTGCLAPRSIALGPFGIFFVGVDGPYILNFLGTLSSLSHQPGNPVPADVQVPFQNTTQSTRISGAFSGNIYRVCVPTTIQGVAQTNDYWFDIRRMRWTGPHTFNYDCASNFGNNFILSGAGSGAALFQCQSIPSSSSVYNDNGAALTSHLRSSSFPKTQRMAQVQVVESTVELSSSGGAVNYNITAIDDQNNTLNSVFVLTPAAGAVWGAFIWGAANWASSQKIPHVYNIPWTVPLNFQKMALDIMATSANQLAIGTFFARYQDTGYTNRG